MDEQRAPAREAVEAVVVGVDGSGAALRAVRWAVREARRRGAALRIVHVAPYALGSAIGARRADAILTLAHTVATQTVPGVPTSTERLAEHMPQALVDATETAQLLVVGMGGGSRFDDLLLHSAALDVCTTATCPVAVIRGRSGPESDDRPAVLGIEDVGTDAAAVTVAFADAHRHGTGLTVLHAVHGDGPVRGIGGRVEREVADALGPWRSSHPDVPVDLRMVSGAAAGHLLEASVSARLLVVGTRARGAAVRTVLGSTSRAVVRRSSCPVVVVRHDARLVESTAGASSTSGAPPRPREPAPWALRPHDRSEMW
jgi:nucleotide-binding universal stress UspA family protein